MGESVEWRSGIADPGTAFVLAMPLLPNLANERDLKECGFPLEIMMKPAPDSERTQCSSCDRDCWMGKNVLEAEKELHTAGKESRRMCFVCMKYMQSQLEIPWKIAPVGGDSVED